MARKPRQLSRDDRAIWNSFVRRVKPLDAPSRRRDMSSGAATSSAGHDPSGDKADVPKSPQSLRLTGSGKKPRQRDLQFDLAPDPGEQLGRAPQLLDRRTSQRLKKGKLSPDARIDLHGMTQAEAYPALQRFILRCHAEGHRLVLVITGKGKDRDAGGPIPDRRGILRHQVPQWLRTAPLNHAILQISEAHLRHGGVGAYYVYLRRSKPSRSAKANRR